MKACTFGKRHSWTFVCNVIISRINGRFGSVSTRGLYRCTCGAKKHGTAGLQIEASEVGVAQQEVDHV